MSDEPELVVTPAEDAPLPVETQDADSSPATDTAPDEVPADDAGDKRPRDEDGKFLSANAQKRIDQLTWEKNQREREAEHWRRIAEQAQQRREPEPPAPQPEAKAPTLEQFNYDEGKYQAALVEFARAEARNTVEQLLARREAETAARAKAETFEKRQAEFMAKTPEYEAKVLRDPTLPISEVMAEVIKESEDGPALALYLAENRELAAQIARLPERAAARELGRLESKLEAKREAATRPAPKPNVSQAPPPPPRIEAADAELSVKASSPESDKISTMEWMKRREKEKQRSKR
jgi:hypothetical protein